MKNTNNTEELVTLNVTDIHWEVDNPEDLCDLPVDLLNLDVPADMDFENDLADAISDCYGFTITSLDYEIIG
jgi:hypothetical protein